VDLPALRAHFPVVERVAYLNAGTDGPVPTAAATAAADEVERELHEGRAGAHFERRFELQAALRAGYASLVGADDVDIALTTSTSEGLGLVLAGLDIGPGDEILTADDEHPGLLGPLAAARERGVGIRMAPLASLHEHVTPATTLVACSHVGWVSGVVAPVAELVASEVPVILDGAQGAGAVPFELGSLGCAAYAAAGQKWLCGADGTGFLWLEPAFGERVRATAPSYMSFEDASLGIDAELRQRARRHDTPALAAEVVAFSLASLGVLEGFGWAEVHAAAISRAASLAERLEERAAASQRAAPPRWWPGRNPVHRSAEPSSPPRASSSATCPAGRCCARPSGRGRATPISSGSWRPCRREGAPAGGVARGPRAGRTGSGGLISGGLPSLNPFATEEKDRSQPVVLRSIARLEEFRAARANLQVVLDVEQDAKYLPDFLKGERTLFVAAGTVDATVDFRRLRGDAVRVSEDRRSATITLPAPRLSEATVDPARSRVFDRSRGLLDRVEGVFEDSPTGERELLLKAEQKLLEAARADPGLLRSAERNTRDTLTGLLRALGFERVTIRFTAPPRV
jgi:L-cysteine/cystine lyase